MAAPIPTTEPESFTAGDSVTWLKSLSDFPPSEGWTVVYCFRGNKLSSYNATGATSGILHEVVIPSDANLLPGVYDVNGFAVKENQRVKFFTGKIQVFPDPFLQKAGEDTRTQNKRTLDNINAVIEGRATQEVLSSMIGDTRMDKIPYKDLAELRDFYMVAVRNEEIKLLQKLGKPSGRTIFTHFGAKTGSGIPQ